MCIILFNHRQSGRYPIIIAHNRDEYFDRPSLQLLYRNNSFYGQDITAGREGGTWLAISDKGVFAALLNLPIDRDGNKSISYHRGQIPLDYLKLGPTALKNYEQAQFILVGNGETDINNINVYQNNQSISEVVLKKNIDQPFAFTNSKTVFTDSNLEWRKTRRLKQLFCEKISNADTLEIGELLTRLDSIMCNDNRLYPDLNMEQELSPLNFTSFEIAHKSSIFIKPFLNAILPNKSLNFHKPQSNVARVYGTRCQTIIVFEMAINNISNSTHAIPNIRVHIREKSIKAKRLKTVCHQHIVNGDDCLSYKDLDKFECHYKHDWNDWKTVDFSFSIGI